MDSMNTPSSALTRYRPILLSITGFAAIYGIYLIYTTQNPAPAAPLHRSGAVHRRRRNAGSERRGASPFVSEGQPILSPLAAYGHFEFNNRNGHRTFLDLRTDSLPTLEYFRAEAQDQDAAQHLVDQSQAIFLDRFFAVVLGPAERVEGADPVDRDRIRVWLMSHGLTESNIAASLGRFNRHQRILQEEEEDRLVQAGLDELYDRQGDSVPATEVALHHRQRDAEGQNLKQLLYYIAEEQSKQEGYVHRGVCCNACGTKPLRGTRWRCANCSDFDLCSDCHAVGIHSKTHIFYEIKIPAPFLGNPGQAQPVAYPGKPHLMPRSIPPEVCKRLVNETNFEKSEVEGLYDQFTCLASYRWPTDPNKLGAAIDRQSFEWAFVPLQPGNSPRPNLIYDRTFAFYDSNGDGLIGFEEFLQGLACLHLKSKTPNKLLKVFEGYDVDADGFVSRKDFLRMFRAFYALQKDYTRDLLAVQQEELTVQGAMDTITSSLPLSSAFTEAQVPPGSQTAPQGKMPDEYGDLRGAKSPVLDSGDDKVDRARILGHSWESQAGYPFDPNTGEPRLSELIGSVEIRDSAFRENREVHFAHIRRPNEDARDDAVRERWRRRQFYTDEEEGFQVVNGDSEPLAGASSTICDADEGHVPINLPSPALRHTPEGSRPASPRSRSSSKVRFQDDIEFDTRSNASTSSRPFNERYGGYEIPEAEKDFGGEILYQVVEDGMNELLDTLFKKKEDLAMEVYATKYERRKWKAQIAAFNAQLRKEKEKAAQIARDPLLAIAEAVENENNDSSRSTAVTGLDEVSQLMVNRGVDEAISHVEQRVSSQSLEELLRENEYPIILSRPADPPSPTSTGATMGEPDGILDFPTSATNFLEIMDFPRHLRSTVLPPSPGGSLAPSMEDHLEPLDIVEPSDQWHSHYDPTMPQFRPNSDHEPRPLHFDHPRFRRRVGPAAIQPSRVSSHEMWPHSASEIDSSQTQMSVRAAIDPEDYLDSLPWNGPGGPNRMNGTPHQVLDARNTLSPCEVHGRRDHVSGPERDIMERFASELLGWDHSIALSLQKNADGKANGAIARESSSPPDDARLATLAQLEDMNREIDTRGGPGRLSFAEFEALFNQEKGLGFVEEWLGLGSF